IVPVFSDHTVSRVVAPFFCLHCAGDHRDLHSFPTRRSSDLAKTLLVDHRWARVGSSNLNVSSLLGNYELDLLAECNQLAAALAQQFLRDLATSREIVQELLRQRDRKSTRLNSSHVSISYAVF